MSDPFAFPLDGTLDLHTFLPEDVKDVVREHLAACREKGIREVRIIHGKGIGTQREIVHALLAKMPEVESFGLADEAGGSWGATIVLLRKASSGQRP